MKASLHDIKNNQLQTEGLQISATLSKIQEDISALKTAASFLLKLFISGNE